MTIWKFPLNVEGVTTIINAPVRKYLKVMMQNGNPTLWAEVDDTQKQDEKHYIACVGTGWNVEIGKDIEYIDSVIDSYGFVWHYYGEVLNNGNNSVSN